MGKSKKSKFSLETDTEIRNDESLEEKNELQKIKTKKKNKTPLLSENTETTKKQKKAESSMKAVILETASVNQKKSKKRKRELVDESVSLSLEEATDVNVETKKKKKKFLANEDDGHVDNVEEPKSAFTAKNHKLKKLNLKNKSISLKPEQTDLEPKQKSKKSRKDDEDCAVNGDSRNSRTIFIGNLPVNYDKKALVKLLNEKGNLLKSWTRGYIPRSEKISKKIAAIANLLPDEHPPVIVYALFETAADAKNALTLNGVIFQDHRLRVTHSESKYCSPECGVFVGNLSFNTTDDDLYDFFSQCGKIISTRVIRNKLGKTRGVAFVNFESTDSVELALKLHEEKLQDREVRVTRMKNKRQIEKMQKRQALQATKDALVNKKHKTKKTESSSDKSDKFQKKKKKLNSVEFKKKILAEKLKSSTKRKEKKSD